MPASADALMAVHQSGRIEVVIGRASDYFGPGADNSGITALRGDILSGFQGAGAPPDPGTKQTGVEMAQWMLDTFGLEPFAYMGSNRDDRDPRWLSYLVGTVNGNDNGCFAAHLRASLLEKRRSIPGETSGSALFCYALAWGIRTEALDRERYWPVVEKAWLALERAVDSEGRLGWVQKPGASPQRVKEKHWAVYGTGAFLLAGSEVLRLVGG